MSTQVETLKFEAEARELLQLMIHSIYSNKDIFLRELISNASDALDKARLEAFRDKDLQVETSDLHIDIETDKEQRTLTVRDNGIGMSRDEVVHLVGTIAKSGTVEFLQKMRESKDAVASGDLIGQFGVGFYSCFMVADKVTLLTRRAGESQATRWESSGEGTYCTPSSRSTTRHKALRSPCTSNWRTRRTTSLTTRSTGRSRRSSSNTPTSSHGPSGWRSSAGTRMESPRAKSRRSTR